jgi:hypothetical protein
MSTTKNVAAAGLLGLAVAAPAAAEKPARPLLPDDPAAMYTQQSRAAVIGPQLAQARNGMVLNQTIWNHHFFIYDPDKPDKLHPSGAAAIDRIVRGYVDDGRPHVLRLFLQRAQDVDLPDEKPVEAAALRDKRDQNRARAVANYLSYAWPDVQYTLVVYDPHPVGINGEEALQGWLDLRQGARGSIPVEVLGGLSITPTKLAGSGPTGSAPPPVLRDSGTGGPSSLGTGQ